MNKLLFFVVPVFTISVICLLSYTVGQQVNRLNANLVPYQLANEAKIKLDAGIGVTALFDAQKTDFVKSMLPFTTIYDRNKQPVASTTLKDGVIPQIQTGVLDQAKQKGVNKVSWQPQNGLRFATVSIPYDNGYVVSGQSLTEYENIVDNLGKMVLLAWVSLSAFSILSTYCLIRKKMV